MPTTSRSSAQVGLACLAVTIVGWGLNWPIIKVLLRDWPPLFSRGAAGVLAALLLSGIAIWRRQPLVLTRPVALRLAAASFTNVFAWMGFTTVAIQWVSVAEGALLVYTMPLWVCLLEWPIRGIRPSGRRLLALALGFAGLVVLLGGELGGARGPAWALGVALALTAALLFAAGTLLLKPAENVTPLVSTIWQVGLACCAMMLIGLVAETDRIGPLSPAGFLSFAYMALAPMGACYLMWFKALERLPPSSAAIATLLVPIVGIVSATFLLGERLGSRELLAIALTMTGVALALRREPARSKSS